MSPFSTAAKNILLQVIHNKTFKKIRPLRSFLRYGARGLANSLALFKGLRFPPQWDWYPKIEFLFGLYEPGTTSVCKRLVKPGMHVVDVGANVGYYALLFSKLVGHSGMVYAFEPHPEIYELLKHNVKGRENIIILQKAVSNANGEIEFYFSKRTTGSHGLYVPQEFIIGSTKVEAVCLDDFLGNKRCDLIKIDVEGAEPLVIEGMGNFITNTERLIIITEYNPSCLRLGGHIPDEFLNILHEIFDAIYLIEEETGGLTRIHGTSLTKEIPEWHAVNLICLKGVSI